MNDLSLHAARLNRRAFLAQSGVGIGSLALSGLFSAENAAASKQGSATLGGLQKNLHHRPRVKRVIFLCMAGGPSHLETFDEKPKLVQLDGQPMPASVTEGQPIAQAARQRAESAGAVDQIWPLRPEWTNDQRFPAVAPTPRR